jgi:hypothetical protein
VIVMPTNNCKAEVHYWAGKYGGLGHLYGPEAGARRGPYAHLPYALDNGAFAAWTEQRVWDAAQWCRLLEWGAAAEIAPLWTLIPDVVTDAPATLASWKTYAQTVRDTYGWPIALAVQDGMKPEDVLALAVQPDVVFVGGSTQWKWASASWWTKSFPRVHIGRVNSVRRLYLCAEIGAESVDGTGWFRGDATQTDGLRQFLEDQQAGKVRIGYLERYGGLFDDVHDEPAWPRSTAPVLRKKKIGL